MLIIVGLGNTGSQYENTPHNAGFVAIDAIAMQYGFPEFQESSKYNSLISEGMINDTKALLAKPQTMMNNSGAAVASLVKQLDDPSNQLVVIRYGTLSI